MPESFWLVSPIKSFGAIYAMMLFFGGCGHLNYGSFTHCAILQHILQFICSNNASNVRVLSACKSYKMFLTQSMLRCCKLVGADICIMAHLHNVQFCNTFLQYARSNARVLLACKSYKTFFVKIYEMML
jgi:hypothetical protein